MLFATIIGILTVLIMGQQIYWANICFKLTNRLMARDYSDFKQAERLTQTHLTPMAPADAEDVWANAMADRANKTLGLM